MKQKKRFEIDVKDTWDLTPIYKSKEEFLNDYENFKVIMKDILKYKNVEWTLPLLFGFDVKIEDKLITEIIDNMNGETFEQRLDAIVEKTEICVKLE